MDRINITGESSIDRADAERAGMDRVNAIWNHPVYQKYYRRLEKLEEKRIFCRHQMTHLLENLGLESCTIATTPQKADRRLLHSRLVRIAGISFRHHNSLRLTLEEISLSST